VWLFGCPRSGSTWLLRLLTRVTRGVPIGEPLIGAHLGIALGGLLGVPLSEDPLVHDVMAERASYFFAPSAEHAWQGPLRSLLVERFRFDVERHESVFGAAGPIIIKEPWGSTGAPVLLRALPASRVVFLVRDGRDVVDSLLDGAADGWVTEMLGARIANAELRERAMREHALMWVRSMDAVQRAFDAHEPTLRYQVKYEDLQADTAAELHRMTEWLGHGELHDRVESVEQELRFSNQPPGSTGAGKFHRAASPGLWVEHFSPSEQAALTAVMEPTLTRLGYTT
jgi:hypothetical protein